MRNIFKSKRKYKDIDPDEIFIDSKNLPGFNTSQFEGRIERPISARTIYGIAIVFVLIGIVFAGRVWALQISNGHDYLMKSESNRLRNETVFAARGMILDRHGEPIAWNNLNPNNEDFAIREYATSSGLSTILGYVKTPSKDSSGNYYRQSYEPQAGVEKTYDTQLSGVNGRRLTETDALGNITSQSVVVPAKNGSDLELSIDKGIQQHLYQAMIEYGNKAGFQGGAGLIMDIQTGELIALSNFPEADSNVMSSGQDTALIKQYLSNKNNPFLNRAIGGLYTPGSIMKPFLAMGVLTEGIIDANKQILSTGSISVPNPYNPSKPSIFKDWKALGWVDLRHAIAMSSDVYFYEVGGGFNDQPGIGVLNIEKYNRLFGFGQKTGIELGGEQVGTIPNPTWKADKFDGEPWRLGDTYNTAIGQYGVQVTPLQAVRATAAIANNGSLVVPTILKSSGSKTVYYPIDLEQKNFDIVKEGMRMTVTEGTAASLNVPYVKISAKTGTAQVGISKTLVNSWSIGYFPSDHPRYAFAVVMESAPSSNIYGASLVMRQLLDYMSVYKSEYFQ